MARLDCDPGGRCNADQSHDTAGRPFAIDRERINRRVPLLGSALGRAYLAYCFETERESIVALPRNSQRATAALDPQPTLGGGHRIGVPGSGCYPYRTLPEKKSGLLLYRCVLYRMSSPVTSG